MHVVDLCTCSLYSSSVVATSANSRCINLAFCSSGDGWMDRRLGVSHNSCRLGDTFPTDGLVRIDFNSSVQLIWSVADCRTTVAALAFHEEFCS